MITQTLNKDGLTRGQAVAAAGVGMAAAYMLKPFAKQFVNELLWDGAELGELSPHDDNSLRDPRNLTGMIVSLAVGAVCRRSAAALIKNGPELISSWGEEIMKHGGKVLCRMHDTIAEAGSSVLDFAKDAIGLNTDVAADAATEVISTGGDAAVEATSALASAGSEAGSGFFSDLVEKMGDLIS